MYYLQSRYYNPEWGRFINADGYAATGQAMLGNNMFAYCGNNPINCVDTAGTRYEYVRELPAGYGGGGGAELLIFPLFLLPQLFMLLVEELSSLDLSWNLTQKEALETSEPKHPVTFPENPYTFTPVGLVMTPRPGTKNGMLISWMDPVSNVEVFRWDENPNYSNGPHYHVMGNPEHFAPGTAVPEPYATVYFPLE